MTLILEDQPVSVNDNIILLVDKFLAELTDHMVGEYVKVSSIVDFLLDLRSTAKMTDTPIHGDM